MRTCRFVSSFLLMLALWGAKSLAANPSETILLWPGAAPGDEGDFGEEKDTTKPTDGLVAGKTVIRLGNVSKPSITIYPAPRDKSTGAAVMICPGGGYHILAMDLEGTEIAEWLNSIGVTAAVLKYRVPARAGRERFEAPLQDAQRAFGLIRQRSADWGIDAHKIGVLGFSAGGHLSAALSCGFEKRSYRRIDSADDSSCRPDFVVLIYPAYLVVKGEGDKTPPEIRVTQETPPTFLVQTEDDGVGVESSLFYYLALKKAKVPAEMHLYATGGHGYGLRPSNQLVTTWPQRAEEWLRARKILPEPHSTR